MMMSYSAQDDCENEYNTLLLNKFLSEINYTPPEYTEVSVSYMLPVLFCPLCFGLKKRDTLKCTLMVCDLFRLLTSTQPKTK